MQTRENKINKIIRELENQNPYYATVTMAMVVAAKVERFEAKREKKVTIFTLHAQEECEHFVAHLEQNKSLIPDNTRFQFVYLFGGHWSSGDIRVKDGKLEFFLLDSIHSRLNYETLIDTIKSQSPDAIVTYCSGETLQRVDESNCGTFAIDLAFQMAKIDSLHDTVAQLNKKPEQNLFDNMFDQYLLDSTLKTLSVADFPATLGPLLRNMQSLSTLRALFFNKGYVANDKKMSLESYVTAHSRVGENESEKGNEKDWKNYTVVDKRRKIKKNASTFFYSLDETTIMHVLDNRKGKNCKLFATNADAKPKEDKDRMPEEMRSCFY